MRTKQEIEDKRLELQKLHAQVFENGTDTPEYKSVVAQLKLLDWVLKIKYFTIEE